MDSSSIQFFYKNVIESSLDSDGGTEMVMTAASYMYDDMLRPKRMSSTTRSANVAMQREAGHAQLFKDYFDTSNPTYKEKTFRRRFRMSSDLFKRIGKGVAAYDDYFVAKPDAVGNLGFTSYQKCFAAIHMLTYGVSGDLADDYICMGESTCLEAMYNFCQVVIAVFGEVYRREPTVEDTKRLLAINESRGFPGMLGSIDCMYWLWKNYPFGWQGQFKGHVDWCTIIPEAVASQDLWI